MSCSENERTAGADRGDQPLPACRLPAARGSVERPRQRHAAAELRSGCCAVAVVIPWAERLTFRTDQIRCRRDNAKYLALIASITLLHQYQRQQVTRWIDGTQQACVIATLDDLEVANRLAGATLGTCRQVLLPQTRQLLEQLVGYVTRPADRATCAGQRALYATAVRERLAWSDRTLRRHLTRLVELEYVPVYRTGCGNQRAYQLLDDHATDTDAAAPLGLIDVRQLRDPSIPLGKVNDREPGG